jgi:hypothetical protein
MYEENSFEKILKQKADAFRMYPSDNVWDAIRQQIDSPRSGLSRPVTVLFILILTASSLVISKQQYRTVPATTLVLNEERSANPSEANRLSSRYEKSHPQKKPLTSGSIVHESVRDASPAETVVIAVPSNENNTASLPPDEADLSISLLKEKAATLRVSTSLQDISFPTTAASEQEQPALTAGNSVPEPEPASNPENISDAAMNLEVAVPVHIKSKPRKELQFYITPSASYRVLYIDNKINIGNLRLNPENAVSHQVATGWEGGIALLSPVTKRLRLKTALQANYTRYRVNASQSGPEVTTVTLTTFNRIQRLTTLRNSEGALPRSLENQTLQISLPLGLEYRLIGNKQLSLNLAATLQPTYMLNATGYLVTTDYRNYIKAPDLLRRYNLNSGIEGFVRFKTKSVDIQAGPQLRYQLFSNSKGKYPIQEHLIDYGFKIGVIKTLK